MICPNCGTENPPAATYCMGCAGRLTATSGIGASSSGVTASRDFIGRQKELGQLKTALQDVLAGRGRLVMLAGEPGIGKTRIAEELEIYATGQGFRTFWGRCYEGEGAPPYWPWVQILRDYVQQVGPDQLHSQMGPGAADIAEIVPELREKLPELRPGPPLEPEQARFRRFDSIARFLKNSAESQPLMLVLDDLHWADRSSLLSMEFLTREITRSRLLLLGTYRDMELSRQHPLAETLGDLTRQRLFERVLLLGLGLGDIARLVEDASEVAPTPELVQAVFTRTEGNPLFVTEVARLLAQEGGLTSSADQGPVARSLRIPQGVREVIGRRLNRLSPSCNETLTVASIIGREFSVNQLKLLLGSPATGPGPALSEDQVMGGLEEAESARVIEEKSNVPGRYQFTHALIQETLAGELTVTRRVRLHAEVAQALERFYGEATESHAAELAYHFAEAETVLGPDQMVRYSLLAGEQALTAYAWEEAQSHFQRALAIKESQPMDEETADILFGLGRAQAAFLEGERLPEAVASLTRAFDYYSGAGDTEKAISAAEYPINAYPGFRTGVAHLLSRGLEIVPPGSLQAGRLWSRLARALMIEEATYQAAQDALDKALEVARRESDVPLEAQALSNGAMANFQQLRYSDALEMSLQSLKLAGEGSDLLSQCQAYHVAAQIQYDMGDLRQSQRNLTAMLAPAARLRSRYYLNTANELLGLTSALVGKWEEARAFYDESFSHLPNEPRVLHRRAILEYEVGEFERGSAFLDYLVDVLLSSSRQGSLVYALTALALVRAYRLDRKDGRLEIAESAAHAHLAAPSATPFTSATAHAALALLAVERGDASTAREQYSWMTRPDQTRQNIWGIPRQRLLGLLSSTLGKWDQAAGHYEASLAYCRRAGYLPELAWTCCDYADTLLQRANSGGRDQARSLLEESLSISTELGMRPLMERVQFRIDGLEPPRSSYPDGLTQREVEVLTLIAQGKNNREIGEALSITESTARRHVSNIYDKIGTANRAEATRYVLERNLLQKP